LHSRTWEYILHSPITLEHNSVILGAKLVKHSKCNARPGMNLSY